MTENAEQKTAHRVGWIGLGVMGRPMCGHLLAAGYEVSVYTRRKEAAAELLDAGASWCERPADVAAQSDVTITMVGYPSDVREVILGPLGVLESAPSGSTIIDMTTSEPTLAVEIADAARAKGVDALDAPVSGGDVGARDAKLVVMVGGAESAFRRVLPLLEAMARLVVRHGDAGMGQHTKMVNQIAIASGMVGVCEALVYAQRAGLDAQAVLGTIGGGAAGSWSLTNYGPRMLHGDFAPGFRVEHFVKDLGIALGAARKMGLALPGLALAEQLYVATGSKGHLASGTQSLVLALAELSGLSWSTSSEA